MQTATGAAQALAEDHHPTLIWLQEIPSRKSGAWVLGVGRDQKKLTDFMGDLHWHLDAVMLLTYVLITLLGYYAMRSIGRTYERRLESQVRERTQALKAAHQEVLSKTRLATIGQTASVLAHEMRNPLASIKLALSGLPGSQGLDERERRRVDLVLGEVDRLDGMLSETLDYVRPVKLSDTPVDLDQLIKNAVEASPSGGLISISLAREANCLVLEITNEGEVLSPDTLQRIFEPFYTTKPKGTGLGLGLVKRVVEEHGGAVELTSDTATGTRVVLHLPLGAD
ncbi:MAG: hypothetical protein LJE70_05235 [Chromatiaceae bacterium]|nr:hypothetical protein [Chromatiaceae bacterium]